MRAQDRIPPCLCSPTLQITHVLVVCWVATFSAIGPLTTFFLYQVSKYAKFCSWALFASPQVSFCIAELPVRCVFPSYFYRKFWYVRGQILSSRWWKLSWILTFDLPGTFPNQLIKIDTCQIKMKQAETCRDSTGIALSPWTSLGRMNPLVILTLLVHRQRALFVYPVLSGVFQ